MVWSVTDQTLSLHSTMPPLPCTLAITGTSWRVGLQGHAVEMELVSMVYGMGPLHSVQVSSVCMYTAMFVWLEHTDNYNTKGLFQKQRTSLVFCAVYCGQLNFQIIFGPFSVRSCMGLVLPKCLKTCSNHFHCNTYLNCFDKLHTPYCRIQSDLPSSSYDPLNIIKLCAQTFDMYIHNSLSCIQRSCVVF